MKAFQVGLMFTAYVFLFVLLIIKLQNQTWKRAGSYAVVGALAMLLWASIPQDAFRAYRNTHEGDRWRLFQYYQTVRLAGVPAAQYLYGVSPETGGR